MPPKQIFGEYTEIDLIGKGSYGKVYTVKSKSDGEVYVLKKVAFDGTPQSEADAALREAHVLSVLRHPHIVPYKEFFKADDGDLCLVMAFCEGGDLFKVIRQQKKAGKSMDELTAWQYLVQMLLSLSYCHSKKILHRDVKTQNIFISRGKVLLGDFGLAKQLQRTLEMARTPIGTPYYMAPEIYEEQPYSFKSDVWALGCVMYEMLTGKPAFGAENLSKVVLRVIRGNYDPLPEQYSEALRGVVGAMLSKNVKKRPDVNDLLTHPHVTVHVQAYLDGLTQEGPGGWSTWRMKLPPSFLASLALIMESSQQRKAGALLTASHSADFGNAGAATAAASPAAAVTAAAARPTSAPRSASAVVPPVAAAPAKLPAFARPALPPISGSATLGGGNDRGPPPPILAAPPDYAEKLLLQHQIDAIGAAAAASRPLRSSGGPRQHHAHVTAHNSSSTSSASPGAGNGPAQRPSSAVAAARPTSTRPRSATVPSGGSPSADVAKAKALEESRSSFKFDTLSHTRAPDSPMRLQDGGGGGRGNEYEVQHFNDDELLSLGHITLYESLNQRAVLLRRELSGSLGNDLLAQACTAIAQAHAGGMGHTEAEEAALRRRVAALMGRRWSEDLWPLLEELQFLESRSK